MYAGEKINFAWSGMSETTINAILTSTDKATYCMKLPAAFDLASQKDVTLYSDYNKFIEKIAELKKNYPSYDFTAEQLVLWNHNFSDDIIKKTFLSKTGKLEYVDFWYPVVYWDKIVSLSAPDILLNRALDTLKKSTENKKYNRFFELIRERQFDLKDEDLKAILKKLNRLVYPQISDNDNMKQLAVKIQLMLKSLE